MKKIKSGRLKVKYSIGNNQRQSMFNLEARCKVGTNVSQNPEEITI